MNLTKLSRNRLMATATRWTVPHVYYEPLYNYLVHGYSPGSFWSAVIANDFMRAVVCSHPSNEIAKLRDTVHWIQDRWPDQSYGDYSRLHHWIKVVTPEQRRAHLESQELIYTEQEEVVLALKGQQPATEPAFW